MDGFNDGLHHIIGEGAFGAHLGEMKLEIAPYLVSQLLAPVAVNRELARRER